MKKLFVAMPKRPKSKDLRSLRRTAERRRELEKKGYTIPQLIRVTGLSRRKVRHWTEIGLLTCLRDPDASGRQAASYYPAEQVMKALIVYEMTKRGLSLAQVCRVETYLKDEEKLTLTESVNYLITDGNTAYYKKNPTTVIDLLKHKKQMLLVPVWEHILQAKRMLRRERAMQRKRSVA